MGGNTIDYNFHTLNSAWNSDKSDLDITGLLLQGRMHTNTHRCNTDLMMVPNSVCLIDLYYKWRKNTIWSKQRSQRTSNLAIGDPGASEKKNHSDIFTVWLMSR